MQVASLQELCLDKIDIHLDRIPSFASLPADIVQQILAHLISLRKLGSRSLTDETAGKFFVPHLAELNLDCVWISSVPFMNELQCTRLWKLMIRSATSHALRVLISLGCKGVNDAALERVVRLSGPTLEWVDVRSCSEIKGAGIRALAACERLRILKCSLPKELLDSDVFKCCTRLHTLKIDTPIQHQGFIKAAVSLPSLERLLLDVVTADQGDVDALSGATKVTSLKMIVHESVLLCDAIRNVRAFSLETQRRTPWNAPYTRNMFLKSTRLTTLRLHGKLRELRFLGLEQIAHQLTSFDLSASLQLPPEELAPTLANATSLTTLALEHMTRLPIAHFTAMTRLHSLSFNSSGFLQGAAPGVVLPTSITQLDLSGGSLTTAEAVATLTPLKNLRKLDIGQTKIGSPIFPVLHTLKELRSINLFMCHSLGAVDFVDMPLLEKVDLSWSSGVKRVEILRCPNLRVLDLSACELMTEGAFLSALRDSLLLENLWLRKTHVGIAFTQELPRLCPFLKQVNFTSCDRINDAAVAPLLIGLRRLRRIYLNSCPVSEQLLAALEKERKVPLARGAPAPRPADAP